MFTKSKPEDTASDGKSKKKSSSDKKRKTNGKDSPDASPKKKANVEVNGSMTLSQREKRAMTLLASYLEERGGMLLVSASLLNAEVQKIIASNNSINSCTFPFSTQGREHKVRTLDVRLSNALEEDMIQYFFQQKTNASSQC